MKPSERFKVPMSNAGMNFDDRMRSIFYVDIESLNIIKMTQNYPVYKPIPYITLKFHIPQILWDRDVKVSPIDSSGEELSKYDIFKCKFLISSRKTSSQNHY